MAHQRRANDALTRDQSAKLACSFRASYSIVIRLYRGPPPQSFQPPGKLCIVAVAGLYRTGKSSLVNYLLERESGFKVGPTVNRCTRGIWMWGRPRLATLPNGETAWVLVLDSEVNAC
jgi:hypothetical protein